MGDITRWPVHLVISTALFSLCWKVISWVDGTLWWSQLRMAGGLLVFLLLIFAALFAWFFGGYLTNKIRDALDKR